jgi:hypothetical protein
MAIATQGMKRGLHRVAALLGISERTAQEIRLHRTSGASIAPHTVLAAAVTLRRERAAQLRAELAEIERQLDDGTALDGRSSRMGASR